MSKGKFGEDCPGCLPAIFNMKTKKVMTPEEFPPLKIIIDLFKDLTSEQKHAWHRITCQNSRTPKDMELVTPFIETVMKVLDEHTRAS